MGKHAAREKTILYSGHKDKHIHGVGIILSKKATQSLIGWKPVSDRIITARIYSKKVKMSIIQAYAPTEDTNDQEKDAFYNQLQDTLDETPKHDIKILMGDMNAQIKEGNQGHEHVAGPHGTGKKTTDNGDRLLMICGMNNMCIGNSYYPHKSIHKKTWKSADKNTNNEIDYICINRKWRSSMKDVRACRGADNGSDHHLVRATIKIKLKRLSKNKQFRPYAVNKLKDKSTIEKYQNKLLTNFKAAHNDTEEEEDEDIENSWSRFKTIIYQCADEELGKRRGTRKEQWIKEDTWELIDERKK